MLCKMLGYSGAFKMFLWVAKSLADLGNDVTIMTFMTSKDVDIPEGIKWIKRDELENKSFFSKVRAIRKEIRNCNSDVSISFLLDANVYNIFACLGLNTKSVVCERNDPFKPGYKVLRFWKPLFRFADGAVYQLPKVAEFYDNIKAPTVVIPNPVQGAKVQALPAYQRQKVVVTLGRLDVFQKRQDVLIRAFGKFHEVFQDYELHIYGSGPDEDRIRSFIRENRLEDCVRMMGVTSSPQDVCGNSMMFVLSSDFEGIPNALVEAMSVGIPCVSTDCRPGGARLLVEDGKNGLLVPMGDSEALAEKMIYLAENLEEADNMGHEAANISERFSEGKIASMWNEYIKSQNK